MSILESSKELPTSSRQNKIACKKWYNCLVHNTYHVHSILRKAYVKSSHRFRLLLRYCFPCPRTLFYFLWIGFHTVFCILLGHAMLICPFATTIQSLIIDQTVTFFFFTGFLPDNRGVATKLYRHVYVCEHSKWVDITILLYYSQHRLYKEWHYCHKSCNMQEKWFFSPS